MDMVQAVYLSVNSQGSREPRVEPLEFNPGSVAGCFLALILDKLAKISVPPYSGLFLFY